MRDDTWQERDAIESLALITPRLQRLHRLLSETGDEFGHRVFYEAIRLTVALERLGHAGADLALDQVVLLKILPRVHGSRRRVEPLLRMLAGFAQNPDRDLESEPAEPEHARLPLTARKV
jgi:5-methylcytosine-specific restriction protein B